MWPTEPDNYNPLPTVYGFAKRAAEIVSKKRPSPHVKFPFCTHESQIDAKLINTVPFAFIHSIISSAPLTHTRVCVSVFARVRHSADINDVRTSLTTAFLCFHYTFDMGYDTKSIETITMKRGDRDRDQICLATAVIFFFLPLMTDLVMRWSRSNVTRMEWLAIDENRQQQKEKPIISLWNGPLWFTQTPFNVGLSLVARSVYRAWTISKIGMRGAASTLNISIDTHLVARG